METSGLSLTNWSVEFWGPECPMLVSYVCTYPGAHIFCTISVMGLFVSLIIFLNAQADQGDGCWNRLRGFGSFAVLPKDLDGV